ncbi:MAG: hypothetical protein ABI629_23570 [bacterium]
MPNGLRWRAAAVAAILLVLMPRLALACPACFAASSDRVSRMYFVSGLLLSILPLVIIGGIAFWCRGRFAATERS